eukprot:7190606-Prymnesium_polylepis.1
MVEEKCSYSALPGAPIQLICGNPEEVESAFRALAAHFPGGKLEGVPVAKLKLELEGTAEPTPTMPPPIDSLKTESVVESKIHEKQ